MLVLSQPAIYALELTPACNNHCPGCSNLYASDRGPAEMPASEWEELLAAFAPEAVQIRLSGGEPTLHPEFFRILEAATSHDAWVTIFTNGRWSTPMEFVTQLRGWPHLSGLLISLHGARATSHEAFSRVDGSFSRTIANIQLAVENDITVALSTIITHQNWNELEAVVDLGRQLSVQHIAFNRYLGKPLPGIEPTIDELHAAVERIEALIKAGAPVKHGICVPQCFISNASEGCLAGVAYVSVDPWGNVRPCAHSPTVIGSLQEDSMIDLWHSESMQEWRNLMPAECKSCAAYSVCHGGCRAMQELRSNGRDPLRQEALLDYSRTQAVRELPSDARPRATLRVRAESFGYALLGQGQVMPVRAEARPVIEACDGTASLAQLVTRFGQSAVDLLGELWELGMLELE